MEGATAGADFFMRLCKFIHFYPLNPPDSRMAKSKLVRTRVQRSIDMIMERRMSIIEVECPIYVM